MSATWPTNSPLYAAPSPYPRSLALRLCDLRPSSISLFAYFLAHCPCAGCASKKALRTRRSARAPDARWAAPNGVRSPFSGGNYDPYQLHHAIDDYGARAETVQGGAGGGPHRDLDNSDSSAYDPERPTWESTASNGSPQPPESLKEDATADLMDVEDGEVGNTSHDELFAQQLHRPTLLSGTQRSPREHEAVKMESVEPTLKAEEVPLPPKEEILAEIMEKDDLIAQLENDLEQAQKLRQKLLSSATSMSHSASTSPFSAESSSHVKPLREPRQPRAPLQLSFDASAMPHFVSEILTANNELARSTCEKIERRLDPPTTDKGDDGILVHRLATLPPQLLAKVQSYLREEKTEAQELSRSLSREYTQRWGVWRKRLHTLSVIEDDGDDELVRIYRQQGGRIRIPTPHTRTVAYAPVNRERFLKTLAQIPALQITPRPTFVDRNHVVEKPKHEENQQRTETAWLPSEEDTFVQMYKKVNKDFVKIAAHLPGRTVKDVIKFYYVNKKRLGLKKFSIALRSYQNMAIEDSSLALTNPLALDDPDNYGSTLQWSGRNTQRSSMRLTGKKTVNYSERALEQAAMGLAAAEAWDAAHPPSDEDEDEAVVWSELEKERFLDAHARWGPDFRNIALFLKTKTIGQCKSFFTKHGKSLGLSGELPAVRGRVKGRAAVVSSPLASSGAQSVPPSTKKKSNPIGMSNKKKGTGSVNTSLNGAKKATEKKEDKKESQPPRVHKKRGRKEKGEQQRRIEVEKSVNSSVSDAPPPSPRFTWSDDQKSTIVALLSVHGRNFAAIAASLDPPVSPESVAEFYATFRLVDSLDDLLPETVRRTRHGALGTGPGSVLGSPFGSPGPVRKKKKAPATPSADDSKKRKREEDGKGETDKEREDSGERPSKRSKSDPLSPPGVAPVLPPPPVAASLPKLPPPPPLKAPVLPPLPTAVSASTVGITIETVVTSMEIETTPDAPVEPHLATSAPDEPPATPSASKEEI